MLRIKPRISLAALLLFLAAAASFAQTETGQISGKVTDPNGQVVPGATVTVKSVATSREVNSNSNGEGAYTVPALQAGLYDVTVKAGSFKPSTKRVEVTVGSRVTADIQVTLTEVSGGTVDVVAGQGVEVNTQTQELSSVVSGRQIRELPTLTRNPYDLIGLAGNVANDDPGEPVAGTGVSGRGAGYQINGQRSASTNLLLDGVDNTNYYFAAVGQKVPLDAV